MVGSLGAAVSTNLRRYQEEIMKKIIGFLLGVTLLATSLLTVAEDLVDLNTAGLKALTTLEHIGKKRAQSIIDYRDANGPFHAIEALAKIPGIGKKTLEANLERMTVQPPAR